MNLESHNFHWRDAYRYNYPLRREAYAILIRTLKDKRISTLTGTRRTGKTTLMKQLIDSLIDNGTPRTNIVYYSFDEEQPSIREIVSEYERRIGKELAFSGDRYFFFLDEVQKLSDWQNKVKYFYDQYENLKFILSGSASLFIRKGARESLAGRTREFSLGPLDFREYLLFKEKEDLISKPEMFPDVLKTEFEKYVLRQYVEIVDLDEMEISDYVKSIVEKVVYMDIPQIFKVEDPNILMTLVKIVSSNPGMLLDYSNLAQTISTDSPVSRARISRYVRYLEDAYILRLGYNYSKSGVASQRKLKKAYLSNASLSLMSYTPPDMGKLVEQTFFIDLGSQFFWRNPQKEEVDIVLERGGVLLPVEVKYRKTITKQDLRGMKSFMRRKKVREGIMITKNTEEDMEVKQGVVRLVPAWKAALFGIG